MLCLTYLSFNILIYDEARNPPPVITNAQHPFGVYAAHNWQVHINQIPNFDSNSDPDLWNLVHTFLLGPTFRTWVNFLNPNVNKAATTAPLYYASSFGLAPIVRFLLEMPDVDVEQRGSCGGATPINIAAMRGHLDVVQILLDHGADPSKRDLKTNLDAV